MDRNRPGNKNNENILRNNLNDVKKLFNLKKKKLFFFLFFSFKSEEGILIIS
jgi:hypothetical protein